MGRKALFIALVALLFFGVGIVTAASVSWTDGPPDTVESGETFSVTVSGTIDGSGELCLEEDAFFGYQDCRDVSDSFTETFQVDVNDDLGLDPGDQTDIYVAVDEDGFFSDSDQTETRTVKVKDTTSIEWASGGTPPSTVEHGEQFDVEVTGEVADNGEVCIEESEFFGYSNCRDVSDSFTESFTIDADDDLGLDPGESTELFGEITADGGTSDTTTTESVQIEDVSDEISWSIRPPDELTDEGSFTVGFAGSASSDGEVCVEEPGFFGYKTCQSVSVGDFVVEFSVPASDLDLDPGDETDLRGTLSTDGETSTEPVSMSEEKVSISLSETEITTDGTWSVEVSGTLVTSDRVVLYESSGFFDSEVASAGSLPTTFEVTPSDLGIEPGGSAVIYAGTDHAQSREITLEVVEPEYELAVSLDSSRGDVELNPPGTTHDGNVEQSYTEGTRVEVVAQPASGYTFSRWEGDVPAGSETDRSLTVTMDGPRTITPRFEPAAANLTVDVRHQNGNRAQEVNGLIVWQDNVGGEPYKIFEKYPSVAIPQKIHNLPGGHEYKINAYIHDQFAGSTGWIDIDNSDKSETIRVADPVWIRPSVYYNDGSTPLEGATVIVETHEGTEWRSASTGGDGVTDPSKLWLHPTNKGYYNVTVTYEGSQVASTRLDSLESNRELRLETTLEGEADGSLVEYVSPSVDTYERDTWYDITVKVENTGESRHTFQVQAVEMSGMEVRNTEKSITLSPGATGTVTFQQRWIGNFVDPVEFQHELFVHTADDGESRQVDSSSLSLSAPAHGDIQFAPRTGDGEPADFDVTLVDPASGETVLSETIPNRTLGINQKRYAVEAGTYDLTVEADGYRTRTTTIDVKEDKTRTVEPVLAPEGVTGTIVDDSLQIEDGAYDVGEHVNATVEVRNTGSQSYQFFVGYSVRSERTGTVFPQDAQTGQFVELAPSETKTVEVSWRVDETAPAGSYDAITALWYGFPEDGAERIENEGWKNGVFRVAKSVREETITYQGTTYTIETKPDNTIVVYNESRETVSADTARKVLKYDAFLDYSLSDPTDGWWNVTKQAGEFNHYYWLAHLNQAGITTFKAYVRSHVGDDPTGEVIDLATQGTRVVNEQYSSTYGEQLTGLAEDAKTAHELYTGTKDVTDYVSVVKEAYELKRHDDSVETMTSAIQAAETADDGTLDPDVKGLLQGLALDVMFAPLNDAAAGLKITQQQSLTMMTYSKTGQAQLQMLDQLAEKRQQGTITPREMQLYYILQSEFYKSSARAFHQVAELDELGEERSHVYSLASTLQGEDVEQQARSSAEGMTTLLDIKLEQMGKFNSRADNLTAHTVNIQDDAATSAIVAPEPLVISAPGWAQPGKEFDVHVESRNRPVINAEVTVGDRVAETDRNGNASFTFLNRGTYDVTVEKEGFESGQTVVQVRDPKVVSRVFEDITLDDVQANTEVTKTTTLENTGETTTELKDAWADHPGIDVSATTGAIEPGETAAVEVTIDTSTIATGPFTENVTVEWADPQGTTSFDVSGNLVETTGSLEVDSNPSGATVFVDGIERGQTPLVIDIVTGEHTVRLEKSGYRSVSRTVTVSPSEQTSISVPLDTENRLPTAVLAPIPSVTAGDSVTLDASDSSDPDGEITTYKWDFDGDGTTDETTSTPETTHIYEEPGTYTVELTVVDNDNNVNETSMTVEVDESEPDSGLSVTREIATETVAPGETTKVTVTAEVPDATDEVGIIENFDPAFESATVVDDDGATISTVRDSTDQLTASWGDRSQVTLIYDVTIPKDAADGDTFVISGTANEKEISGDSKITVSKTTVESADRTISNTSPAPGETVEVTVDVRLDGDGVIEVTDTISPEPETVAVTDADGATIATSRSNDIVASWGGNDSASLIYEVTIPDDAEDDATFSISGTVNGQDISGDDELTVSEDPVDQYRNKNGIVDPQGLLEAASDFRNEKISPSTLLEVAAAFRTGG